MTEVNEPGSKRMQREATANGQVTFDGNLIVNGANGHPTRPAPFIRVKTELWRHSAFLRYPDNSHAVAKHGVIAPCKRNGGDHPIRRCDALLPLGRSPISKAVLKQLRSLRG